MVSMKNPHYSGFWIRVLALVFDGLLGSVIFWLFGLLVYSSVGGMEGLMMMAMTGSVPAWISYLQWALSIAVIAVVIYMEGILGGTPGKLLLGLRIVNEKGDHIGIPGAILRYIGKFVAGIILGIGLLMVAFNVKKQGLHDKIAGTYVVYT
ncbi:RDD family protein [Candidatus Woesearchaeota archaeon CG10_big_fil_rev_8_21_14_0_10_30_7]|nr:MAG: RDD family protein [Candidatus Woesearchaeota archaeon CG10_big_fil_rev_8_21_14_0_10_30_7]